MTGTTYQSIARYTCFNGFFVHRNDTVEVRSVDVTCNASGMWEPSPSEIECNRKYDLFQRQLWFNAAYFGWKTPPACNFCS